MPTIYDNIKNKLAEGLNIALAESLRADFCVGYFNMRGWQEVADQIDRLPGAEVLENGKNVHRICRLLVGMQKMPEEMLREHFFRNKEDLLDQAEVAKLIKKAAQEFKDQLIIGPPSNQDEAGLRRLARQLAEEKVAVKLHLAHTLHAKLYLAYDASKRAPLTGFLGSSNLTMAGLSKQGELNIDVDEQDAAGKLVEWFENRWKDRWCIDITKDLIEIIDKSWATDKIIPPYHIYLKIAYHLSQEARAGLAEYSIPALFRKELLPFQSEAVRVAAKKLHKRDGVMVGDVVGLGKTITACAIAKMFEEDYHYNTLIICPKNLVAMWDGYVLKYEMRARVISMSQLQKELPKLRQYTFRQVIIDESHNLRNDEGSRYRLLKEFLEENNGKLILLSATPYNKTYRDLSNQLRLFLPDDKDLGISPENHIASIGGALHFAAKHPDTHIRSIKAFEKSDSSDDWRELMRLYLVRRTRSFIKANYAGTDPDNGRKFLTFSDGGRSYFPERIPKKVGFAFDEGQEDDLYAKLYSEEAVAAIAALKLPRYGLQTYLDWDFPLIPSRADQALMKNLSRAGRLLMGFCRTNLFKRLESGGYPFLLSVARHILRNYVFVYALQNDLPLPISKKTSHNLDGFLEDADAENTAAGEAEETEENAENQEAEADDGLLDFMDDESLYLKKAEKVYRLYKSAAFERRFDWIAAGFFADHTKKTKTKDGITVKTKVSLLGDLIDDSRSLLQIMTLGKGWSPESDRKLNALHDLLVKSHPDEKTIVFTQFADTALYLAGQLEKRGLQNLRSVTGSDKDPTELAKRFSPRSNGDHKTVANGQELRVLIATDVLSEGQNLQDAHIIVNYDLPWAIIRLIQRAGRVDRIGQKAEQILCYSFLPEEGIDKIISLRGRLKQRIAENANVVGSDETFFDGDPVNLADLYNEKSGILDGEDDEEEVDLASYAYQIWKNATDQNPSLKKTIPEISSQAFAAMQNHDVPQREGAIVYTRTPDDNDVLAWVGNKGQIITLSQHAILRAARCGPTTPHKEKAENHHELVQSGLDFIREDEKNTGGALGKRTGVKYRIYTRLERYCNENAGTLFVPENLKMAIDDIFRCPLKELARDMLNRELKAGAPDAKLADLVMGLRDEKKLTIAEGEETDSRNIQIVCSLGIRN